MKKYLIAIGGASGSIYGIKLLEFLKNTDCEVHLVLSEGGKEIIKHETTYSIDNVESFADIVYDNKDLFSAPASGSFRLDGMIVVPCSMKTLSAIANGYGDTLISRSASCMLKENRQLILVPRETPLDLPGIKNMLKVKQAGAIVLPSMPGFYHRPEELSDLIHFIVGKILDQMHIDHSLFKRWSGKK